ncbi:hypothetical protein [Maribacter dokdonensis]|nr:hypothetical protein [Maribacter dokdonensis]
MVQKKKYSAFDHASHNLDVHNLLKDNGHFFDWEVTTAFYAALKFFEGSLFPGYFKHPDSQKTTEYKTYNDYRSVYNRFIGGTPHDAMKYFVKHNTNSDVWLNYKELYEVCHVSRYKNYLIEEDELEIARESLEEIRVYCIENQTN